ncbi:recombinase family protein [Natronospira bacteriovora]|uniref:Recombinase family protein n=1 Tax=Natronospira bacteriovora TaxID=3069753 RepID=A0ABU0W5L7_9GAMM|nr:recombinase family protein [Natronospira sp. AB-CW4]MDQ2069291.1 recombinase family protein [Natronospira sp. AB-CW4]
MRLIGYIRVSTDEQARDGHSLMTQRRQIEAFAGAQGDEIVHWVSDEGVSASKPLDSRLGGGRLIEDMETFDADGVIVQRLDRLFRLGVDAITTGTWFREQGRAIKSVSEGIDISTRAGWLSFFMLVAVAENERLTISERAKETSDALREQGRVWGPVPYGCVEVDGRVYRDPAAWALREQIVGWKQTMSYRALSDHLRAHNIPSPAGKNRWSISTLRAVVMNHHDYESIPPLPEDHETEVSGEVADA